MKRRFFIISKRVLIVLVIGYILFPQLVLAGPATNNYELKEYGFGAGGTEWSSTSNYSLFGVAGEVDQGVGSTDNYQTLPGLTYTVQAALPPAPTVSNPADYYNKLQVVVNISDNPSDALYAISISTDNFSSDIRYVQSTNAVGSALGSEDWQTYTSWGSGSGFQVLGLSPGTTYYFRVAAKQGDFTETGFGPISSVATSNPSLTFDIDVSSIDEETAAPYSVDLGDLAPSSVTTSANKIWVDVSTNATAGALVYVYGTNNGLLSTSTSNSIVSTSGNLANVGITEGYGARYNSLNETSGGPMEAIAPYDGSADNVGVLDTTKRIIFDSSDLPVTNGRASFEIKAKISTITEAAEDYSDVLTVIATATY